MFKCWLIIILTWLLMLDGYCVDLPRVIYRGLNISSDGRHYTYVLAIENTTTGNVYYLKNVACTTRFSWFDYTQRWIEGQWVTTTNSGFIPDTVWFCKKDPEYVYCLIKPKEIVRLPNVPGDPRYASRDGFKIFDSDRRFVGVVWSPSFPPEFNLVEMKPIIEKKVQSKNLNDVNVTVRVKPGVAGASIKE